ncbi:MAG: glycosyltransferase family 39 protein [Clostridia bacterium]|nr:glycosyltransferase family 39 protein [Clostridia bacterium]
MTKLKQSSLIYKCLAVFSLSLVMFMFLFIMGETLQTALLFSVLYLGVISVFAFCEKTDNISLLFIFAAVSALICIRVSLLPFASRDYNVFLSDWLEKMRGYEGAQALRVKIGDYNMPYLYFLFILSKLNLNDLVVIKWFSCVFDFILAFFVMKCVEEKSENTALRYGAFIVALATPTVLMNSAYWGQCDSILAAFCVASFYFILKGNGKWATIMFALAFSFKLQAIFILPAFIVAVILKRIRLKELLLFPLTFIATLLPAIIVGRPIKDTIGIYFLQTSQYPELTLNAPSIFQFVSKKADFETFNFLGIMFAGLGALTFIYLCFYFKDKISGKQLVTIFYLSALLLPFLLPRMHERYFFIADLMGIIFLFYNPNKWYLPLMSIFASYNACANYLSGGNLLVEQKYTAFMLMITIILLVKTLIKDCRD